jgi:hypothetical protein
MEVWTDVGDEWADKAFVKSKRPTIITLIDGDSIALRARDKENRKNYVDIELSETDLYRLFQETLKKHILTYEQEQKLIKLINQ